MVVVATPNAEVLPEASTSTPKSLTTTIDSTFNSERQEEHRALLQ